MTDKERCNGESTHKCLQCKKSFGGTKTHNEPHLKCTQCKYETNTKAKLRQHISTHIQEKKFNCNQCNKLFGTRSSLITHLITHGENINNKKKTIKTHKNGPLRLKNNLFNDVILGSQMSDNIS